MFKFIDGQTIKDLDALLSGNYSSFRSFGFCGTFDGQGYNIEGLHINNHANEGGGMDTWTGGIHDEGGFIGMLTSRSLGSETAYGTIRNISFTEAIHGDIATTDWNRAWGTHGGFLCSVSNEMCIENVNIHLALRLETYGVIGGNDWHVQLCHNSVLRNVMITVDADKIARDGDNVIVNVGRAFNIAAYDQVRLENLYIVVGQWDELSIKDDGTANRWGSSGAGAADTNYGCKTNDRATATTPSKACASFTELKGIIDSADNRNTWDSEYWEFPTDGDKAGTPVFKQKQ